MLKLCNVTRNMWNVPSSTARANKLSPQLNFSHFVTNYSCSWKKLKREKTTHRRTLVQTESFSNRISCLNKMPNESVFWIAAEWIEKSTWCSCCRLKNSKSFFDTKNNYTLVENMFALVCSFGVSTFHTLIFKIFSLTLTFLLLLKEFSALTQNSKLLTCFTTQ